MRAELLEELKEITRFLSDRNRLSGSQGVREAQDYVRKFVAKRIKVPVREETFQVEKYIPVEGKIKINGREIKAYPFPGSTWGEIEGVVVREEDDVEGKIALAKVGEERESEKARRLKERGALAVIFYTEAIDSPYFGTLNGEKLITLTVDRKTAEELTGNRVSLISRVRKTRLTGRNLYFDIGKGPFLYLIAHIDSKPFVKGAIDNALSVALILMIAKEIRDTYSFPYRIRFLITDCEEMGLEGAKHHVENLKHTYYAIAVDSVGWVNPAVLYKDNAGYNGERIMEKFFRHLKDLKIDIPFRESRRARSDHIPFKEKGVQTLFLTSNPFTL
ncbi:MAG: M28 family peptidase, partial [Aquificota bacterium]|nr:M28 family peptidase [Aquificota bacterium]